MKIVSPSATLLHITKNAEQLIERCGRVCYKSEDKITSDSYVKFIKMIIKSGHLSVLEHGVATVHFVCDRGISHEFVRHRIISPSQESTRYCNYGKGGEISVIQPPGLQPRCVFQDWRLACVTAESMYLALLAQGMAPQIARSVLPTCLKTEIVVTANFREWLHIFNLRTSPKAHPQIREIMLMAQRLLRMKCPVVFGEAE